MTKEEWKQAEEALTHFFHPVELKVDGYDITLILERVSVYQKQDHGLYRRRVPGPVDGRGLRSAPPLPAGAAAQHPLRQREGRVRTAAEAEAEGTAREVPHAIFLLHPAVVILSGAEETLLRQQPKASNWSRYEQGFGPRP
ncbi:hypothetical protein M5E87_29195 [Flavonifractor plautii]|nr:hypothetical protein M5E87_29195 [Flavonifractor plautii]